MIHDITLIIEKEMNRKSPVGTSTLSIGAPVKDNKLISFLHSFN